MVTTTCDKCGKKMNNYAAQTEVNLPVDSGSGSDHREMRFDFCMSCVGHLDRWLKNPFPQEAK